MDSNGVRRPQPTKIYVMPGPCPDGSVSSQTPIVRQLFLNLYHQWKVVDMSEDLSENSRDKTISLRGFCMHETHYDPTPFVVVLKLRTNGLFD